MTNNETKGAALREFNPEMLTLAREAREMTQTELAQNVGLSQSKLSKLEDGLIELSQDTADALALALGFPVQFFFQRGVNATVSPTFFRKHATLERSVLRASVARMAIIKKSLQRLTSAAERLAVLIPHSDPDEFRGGPAAIARHIRLLWRLPHGPVKSLTAAVEDAGIVVIPFTYGSRKVAGCSDYIDGIPTVFLNREMTPARWRFTLAHELAHLVMHRLPSDDPKEEESQANIFAAEFLLPEDEVKSMLLPINIGRLARLKLHWRVSMAALLKRAGDLGVISERTERYWFMRMSQHGYREEEPYENDIPREEPTLLKELVDLHLTKLGYSVGELAQVLSISESDFKNWIHSSAFGFESPTDGGSVTEFPDQRTEHIIN